MHDFKLINNNSKKIAGWGAGLLLLGSIIFIIFVPIHPTIPAESDLSMSYTEAHSKWETQTPQRYTLEIHQDNSYLTYTLTVLVENEQVTKVITKTELPTSPYYLRKLIKTEEATVSHLFQLAQTNINNYKSPHYQACPRSNISMPVVVYDSKFGYPTALKYQNIQVESNFDRLLGRNICHPMAVPKQEDAFRAEIFINK